jgi:hypothetical protein
MIGDTGSFTDVSTAITLQREMLKPIEHKFSALHMFHVSPVPAGRFATSHSGTKVAEANDERAPRLSIEPVPRFSKEYKGRRMKKPKLVFKKTTKPRC